MSRIRITQYEIDRAIELWRTGLKSAEIAKKMRITKSRAYEALKKSREYQSQKREWLRINELETVRALELWRKELKHSDIAQEMGIKISRVARLLHKSDAFHAEKMKQTTSSAGVPRRTITNDEVASVVKLQNDGFSYSEIKDELGITLGRVKKALMKSKKFEPQRAYKKVTQSDILKVFELSKKGMKSQEIANQMGMQIRRVSYILQNNKIE